MKTNKSKKFKELKVGDVIYFCNHLFNFNKETILNGNALQVREFKIDKIVHEKEYVTIQDFHLGRGRGLCLSSNVMKAYKPYHMYSTSKEFIEKEIKRCVKQYMTALKEKVNEGKKAEKELNELLNSKIIL
jgi:hypothetical protein